MTHPSSNRRYVKRVWRVPKDRGALEMFAALTVKIMRKHGWPVTWQPHDVRSFFVLCVDGPNALPPDVESALRIAVRILARTYDVETSVYNNCVSFECAYIVSARGTFRKAFP